MENGDLTTVNGDLMVNNGEKWDDHGFYPLVNPL